MPEVSLVVGAPGDCSAVVIEQCLNLICLGGAIPASRETVEPRIMRAKVLAYVLIDGHIVGVAALKVPVRSYRDRISRRSGFSIPDWKYPLELGYLVVDKSARGQKLSTRLVDAVLGAAGDSGLFATTSSAAVHKILPQVGFVVQGNTYKSNDGDELTLYVRDNSE